MNKVIVNINVLEGGRVPVYKHPDDACCDAYARLVNDIKIEPWSHITIPLGFKLGLPEGYKAVVNPRSGLASRNGIVACVGEIDEGFKGEVGCTIFNFSDEFFYVHNGDRICQIEFQPYYQAEFIECNSVGCSERGEGGFGSSGV